MGLRAKKRGKAEPPTSPSDVSPPPASPPTEAAFPLPCPDCATSRSPKERSGDGTGVALRHIVLCLKTLFDILRIVLVLVSFLLGYELLLVLGIAAAIAMGNSQASGLPRGWKPAWQLMCDAWRLWFLGVALPMSWWLCSRYGPILIDRIRSSFAKPKPSAPSNRPQARGKEIVPAAGDLDEPGR